MPCRDLETGWLPYQVKFVDAVGASRRRPSIATASSTRRTTLVLAPYIPLSSLACSRNGNPALPAPSPEQATSRKRSHLCCPSPPVFTRLSSTEPGLRDPMSAVLRHPTSSSGCTRTMCGLYTANLFPPQQHPSLPPDPSSIPRRSASQN